MRAAAIRTMGDHIDATRLLVNGVPDHLGGRYERLKGIRFDGLALGHHPLTDDKEPNKRVNEMLALGHVLVGSGAVDEVGQVTLLKERPGVATPDFEAILLTGRTVRIELVRLADQGEKIYLNALTEIARRTNEALRDTPDILALLGTQGRFHVRFYSRVTSPKGNRSGDSRADGTDPHRRSHAGAFGLNASRQLRSPDTALAQHTMDANSSE